MYSTDQFTQQFPSLRVDNQIGGVAPNNIGGTYQLGSRKRRIVEEKSSGSGSSVIDFLKRGGYYNEYLSRPIWRDCDDRD